MFRLLRWSLPLQPPQNRLASRALPAALTCLVDDCERRLARAPETPRQLQILADYGVRALCGRFPG